MKVAINTMRAMNNEVFIVAPATVSGKMVRDSISTSEDRLIKEKILEVVMERIIGVKCLGDALNCEDIKRSHRFIYHLFEDQSVEYYLN